MSKISFQLDSKAINKVNDLEMGAECKLVLTKVEKKGRKFDAVMLMSNNEAIAEVYCGQLRAGIAHAAQEFFVNADYYNGIIGTFCGINVTAADADGSQNFVMYLDNVTRDSNPEQPKNVVVNDDELPAAIEIFDNFYAELDASVNC